MRGQKIKEIDIKDLVLWTVNPRDPIDENATDQDVVNHALNDKSSKWNLARLSKEMGNYYDYSELPTVILKNGKYIVLDGNRRMILGKIKHNIVEVDSKLSIPDFPRIIPCNVCPKDIAIENVYRKHADSGTWDPLERDIFANKYMREEKSLFLLLDENTHFISSNPHLNKGFVRDEIFKEETLKNMGFTFKKGKMYSAHNNEEALSILEDISEKIKNSVISTRKNRGRIFDVLDGKTIEIINNNKNKKEKLLGFSSPESGSEGDEAGGKNNKHTRRTSISDPVIFGKKLVLKHGNVNNIYRDILDMYEYYRQNKKRLSGSFPSLIRMALRMLVEAATSDNKLEKYVKTNFTDAKNTLDQDQKTLLSTQNVTENSMVQLLHVGAHNYSATGDLPQTIALSIIIGAILSITHGKEA